MTALTYKHNVLSVIYVTLNLVFVLRVNLISVYFVKENSFIYSLIMTGVRSFLMKTVPAYHLEPEQTPAFRAQSNITVFPRLLVIQFQLCTPDTMSSFVSKLRQILERGHRDFKEMLAGHVPTKLGCLQVDELPLLIVSNVSSRPMRIAVIDTMKYLKLIPTKILTQNNGANEVDLYLNNENLPRFLDDVILGQYQARQVFHQGRLDLVAARMEVRVSKENNIWYMPMEETQHLNLANILRTKAELNGEAPQTPPKRSNPYQIIQKIKKARENRSTTGPTTSAPPTTPKPTDHDDTWEDDQELIQILNDSVEQAEPPASSSPTTQETSIPIAISSLTALLESVQGVCADALRSCRQLQSK